MPEHEQHDRTDDAEPAADELDEDERIHLDVLLLRLTAFHRRTLAHVKVAGISLFRFRPHVHEKPAEHQQHDDDGANERPSGIDAGILPGGVCDRLSKRPYFGNRPG